MLKHRLITGTALVAVLAVIVFVPHIIADVLMAALAIFLMVASLREYFRMTELLEAPGYRLLTTIMSLILVVMALPLVAQRTDQVATYTLTGGLYLVGCFLLAFQEQNPKQGLMNYLASAGGLCYLGIPLAFLVHVYYFGDSSAGGGPYLFFFLILVTKCGDIGGYTLGMLTARGASGNHKLVPRLSPKKSWEGLAGSLFLAAFAGWLIALALGGRMQVNDVALLTPLAGAGIGLVLALVGLAGDLAASLIKRASGVKDTGAVLPGMGGVLDMLDSLVLAAPLYYAFLCWRAA